MTRSVGLLGDVMLGRGVAKRLATSAPGEVWERDVLEIAVSLDVVICNLECSISERGQPTGVIPGKPFFFRGPPAAVESLRAIGVRAVSLANNHALDYGPEALADTIELLNAAGIASAGAGLELQGARQGVEIEVSGERLGLLALSDHPRQFAAEAGNPGTAYADLRAGVPTWAVDELRCLRESCAFVIAFPHWGANMTVRPTSWQREVAAELLEAGADLVAGHSAHVFHGVERVDGRLAAYDLGDALDDYAVDRRLRNDLGLLAIWRAESGEETKLELVGLFLDYCRTGLATGGDADWIARRLELACGELGTSVERVGEQRFRIF